MFIAYAAVCLATAIAIGVLLILIAPDPTADIEPLDFEESP